MTRPTLLAAIAMLALAGCDRIPFLQGDANPGNSAAANASAGNASAAAPPNAGIGSSRSLAGLAGNSTAPADQPGQGGKDPTAIQASASEGGVDPRLVGRWTDDGDCKSVMELRADGSFLASSGVAGRWEVNGNELIFLANGGQEFRLRVDSVGPDSVATTNAQGESGTSTRC